METPARRVVFEPNELTDKADYPWILSLREETGHLIRMALTWEEVEAIKFKLPHCFCEQCRASRLKAEA